MKINREEKIPLYKQIANRIEQKIQLNEFKPESKVPPYKKLAELFGVSMVTIQQSMKELSNKGLIYSRQGQGTFVSPGIEDRKRSNIIGFLLTNLIDPLFNQVVTITQDILMKEHMTLVPMSIEGDLEKFKNAISLLLSKNADGFLIIPIEDTAQEECYWELKYKKKPFIYLDMTFENVPSDYVIVDIEDGVKQGIDYLVELGHRKIGCVSAQPFTLATEKKLTAFKHALKSNSIPILEEYIQIGAKHLDEGSYSAAKKLLHRKNPPTALFVTTDIIAVGVYKAAKEMGIRIPDDLSIVSYSNSSLCTHIHPPLTSIGHSLVEKAKIAVDLLLSRIQNTNEPVPYQKVILKSSLVIRESCTKFHPRKRRNNL